ERRNCEAERRRSREIDDQLELGPHFDRQVASLFAFENPPDIHAGAAISIRLTWSVADQAANFGVLALVIDRGQGMPACERHELPTLAEEEWTSADAEPSGVAIAHRGRGAIGSSPVCRPQHSHLPYH